MLFALSTGILSDDGLSCYAVGMSTFLNTAILIGLALVGFPADKRAESGDTP